MEEISRLRKKFHQRDSSGRITSAGAARASRIIEKGGGYIVGTEIFLPPGELSEDVKDAVDYLVLDWDMERKENGKD